jgi:hypothetical protein
MAIASTASQKIARTTRATREGAAGGTTAAEGSTWAWFPSCCVYRRPVPGNAERNRRLAFSAKRKPAPAAPDRERSTRFRKIYANAGNDCDTAEEA